jgi:hypothetical protein
MTEKHEDVRIHIDRKPYESPNPTTDEALYVLGHVPHGHQLFRSVQGDEEDVPVLNDKEKIHLFEDEHFYSQDAKGYKIIVNGRTREVTERQVSFSEIVKLAYDKPPEGENIVFTVSYRKGPRKNSEGTLGEGQSVKVKNGMIFNVTATDKS